MLAVEPRLVGVRPAREVVPGLDARTILHAAPPTSFDDAAEVLRGGLEGGALFEGIDGEPVLAAAQDHGAMAGGAGVVTASTPVVVLEDARTGATACHFVMEGFGRSLVLGMHEPEVLERLAWLRDELAPALDAALGALGGLDVVPLMAEALRRGDELHNRNAAATSLLAERLAIGFVRAGVDAALVERALAFLQGNPQFFVAVSLAWARLALDAGDGVEGSSLLVAVGANGRECGLRVSGVPGRWFTAPAETPVGVFLEGFGPEDAGPGCGDSLAVECAGLGASVLPAAPALWPLLGVDEAAARRIYEDARRIALAEDPRFRVSLLGDAPAPAGVDVLRVVETGIRPTIDIVMIHRERGRGMIGFGLTSPPLACFEQAAAALRG